jgi:Ca-activated chloride channel family protein
MHGLRGIGRFGLAGVTALALSVAATAAAQPADAQPTFRSAVNLVSVSAVVKDNRGRPVRNLRQEDFTILENGAARPIVDFGYTDDGPVSFGVLVDQSGSMQLARNLDAARDVVRHLLAWFDPLRDEVALFAFDEQLARVQDFTSRPGEVADALPKLSAYGTTALYDAIAATSEALVQRPTPRRALIVITDGLDTTSRLTAAEVSGMASAIDVPVYVVAVMSPMNHPERGITPVVREGEPIVTSLANLARWTGGDMLVATTPAETSRAARQFVVELRHQYLLAFESSTQAGWHRVSVLTRKRDLEVRARSGYMAEGSAAGAP